ncbi:hypothetical protein RJD28_13280 [Oscillospiraceae bacterium NTUH-002-81]|nr:hypothetical protein RJD28_13280 [Oscillospiraceae bacterium NTUH-002-81]
MRAADGSRTEGSRCQSLSGRDWMARDYDMHVIVKRSGKYR